VVGAFCNEKSLDQFDPGKKQQERERFELQRITD
jgi:hypothetical protein